jgi:hypothetical protein
MTYLKAGLVAALFALAACEGVTIGPSALPHETSGLYGPDI